MSIMPIYRMHTKKLSDGSMLVLLRWLSDIIEPGREMYAIDIHQSSICTPSVSGYPEDFENFTYTRMREVYDSVERPEHFNFLKLQRKLFLRANHQSHVL